MQHHREFGRFAEDYGRYSLIQERVAKALAVKVGGGFRRIVDIGCGSGGFFRAYEHPLTYYCAVDFSETMLDLHPDGERVEKIVGDFDDPALYRRLSGIDFDLLVSSSALQWSRDLDLALGRIAALNRPVALAIFTSGTFASLHETAGTGSPIRSEEETIDAVKRHFDAAVDTLRYRLYFKERLSMLRYIKRSGVSGGRQRLTYSETKKIVESYPLPYLEFEVVRAVSVNQSQKSP
ncbi:methyltransferase [Hydrogenimonas sp.]